MEDDFSLGPWLIRPDRNAIEREGEQRPIEPKAMDVLVFLADHAGEVLAKERIINAIWPDAFVTDDVLTHAIAFLRKALGDDSKNPRFIRTIPRRGYLLLAEVKPLPEVSSVANGRATNGAEQFAHDADPLPAAAPDRTRHRGLWLAAAVALIVTVCAIYWFALSQSQEPQLDRAVEQRKSIVILPFENPSGNAENEYFSAGITEDITTALTKIGALRVVGRTASFPRRSRQESVRDVVRQIGAGTILEGSVRRTGRQVRIVARLIAAETDELLWAETYDRNLDDIFGVQTNVAEQIASALRVKLTPEETRQVERQPTSRFEAYNLCLRGRYFRFHENYESLRKSVESFEKAVNIDPTYALAYAGLAEAYVALSWFSPDSRPQLLEKALAAVRKALELDNTLSEAHVSMFLVNDNRGDPAAAIEDLRRAINLNPNSANAHRELGLILWRHDGMLREALAEVREAYRLDPLSALVLSNLNTALLVNGLVPETISKTRELGNLHPTDFLQFHIANLLFVLSDWRGAETWYHSFLLIDPKHKYGAAEYFARAHLQQIYWLDGRTEDAKKGAQWWLEAPGYPGVPHRVALLFAGLTADMEGDDRKALEFFEKAHRAASNPVEWSQHVFFQPYEYSTWLGYAFRKGGRLKESEEKLDKTVESYRKLIAAGEQSLSVSIGLAGVCAIRRQKEEAYRYLEQAIHDGFLQYALLERHPFFANLHDDTRFQQMMTDLEVKAKVLREPVRKMEKEWRKR